MVLIFINWIYILFTSIAFGIGFKKLFRLQSTNIVVISILGLFTITMFASIFALFGPINLVFNSLLLLFSTVIIKKDKDLFFNVLGKTRTELAILSSPIKLLLVISSILILVQSATLPFIIDNETYYIQTIKWLNEYGFVPGLANLHLFLGQTSGWHITQSVYSLPFLYDRFNDLNSFCLLLGNYWAFQKLHSYFITNNRLDLAFGLLPMSYAFLFQFINAPSPDFPIYIFGIILFSLYLEKKDFILISVVALFLFYIKITAVVLLLLPLQLLFTNCKDIKNKVVSSLLLLGLVSILFVIKNSIITGYPLFPLTFISLPEINYVVPKEVVDFFFSQDMMHSFYLPFGSLKNATSTEIIYKYFFSNGIDGIIGITTVTITIISPFILYKKFKQHGLWSIYFIFMLLLALLAFSSPQYRFYVYFTIFFMLLLFASIIRNKKIITGLLGVSLASVAVLVFVPMSFSKLTNNKLLTTNSTFQLKNCFIPEPISKENQKYLSLLIGNMRYYSPHEPSFFWITGNGNLPCVNEEQINYFETNFHIIPQMRGANLSNGFCSQKIIPNE